MTTTQKLQSTLLVEAPDLFKIVDEFVTSLVTLIVEIEAAHAAADWTRMIMLAHRLKGAGGAYGYQDLTDLGREMESDFSARDSQRFEQFLRDLRSLSCAARAGLR